mgnify:CR=1 FL=1
MERRNAWLSYTEAEEKELEQVAKAYRNFLNVGKTERECVTQIIREARAAGYESLEEKTAKGEKLKAGDTEYYSFPTPQQLSGATEEELRRLGMGYRARYIVETTRSILEGEVSLEKLYQMKYYRRARKELMKLSGVGEKVADCICLFALHHMDAFPIDTHIRQVLDEHYRRGFPNRRYHGMRGIMQQYIFYYELIGERGKI